MKAAQLDVSVLLLVQTLLLPPPSLIALATADGHDLEETGRDKDLIKDRMSGGTEVDEEHMFTYGDDPEEGGRAAGGRAAS